MNRLKTVRIFSVILLIISIAFSCGCNTESEPESVTVYITETGTKYHLSSCSSLWNSKIEIELEKAIEEGYTSCKRCNPPKE